MINCSSSAAKISTIAHLGPSGLLEFVVATESPEAIQAYQDMFDYFWSRAIPADEAVWGETSE